MNFLLSIATVLAIAQSALAEPSLVFKSSAAKVEAGHEFTIGCEVKGVTLAANTAYKFEFWKLDGPFLEIEAKPPARPTFTKLTGNASKDLNVANNSHLEFPLVEAKVNPAKAETQAFWCTFKAADSTTPKGEVYLNSNVWNAGGDNPDAPPQTTDAPGETTDAPSGPTDSPPDTTDTPPETTDASQPSGGPVVQFSTGVSASNKLEASKPFLATCEVKGVTLDDKSSYRFEFWRAEGAFAFIEAKVFKQPSFHLLPVGSQDIADIQVTEHEAFPKVQININLSRVKADVYWCTFNATSSVSPKGEVVVGSNMWNTVF